MADPEKKRLFVAIYPSREVVETLTASARLVSAQLPARAIRWTLPEQIHLTLNFLGYFDTARIPELDDALLSVCGQCVAHPLRAAGLGCFPNLSRPSIIWAGLTGALAPLLKLKRLLDESLEKVGYVPEKRPFHPHLTIARVSNLNSSQRRLLACAISGLAQTSFGQWNAQKVDLVESVLSATGSSYSVLKSFSLCAEETGED